MHKLYGRGFLLNNKLKHFSGFISALLFVPAIQFIYPASGERPLFTCALAFLPFIVFFACEYILCRTNSKKFIFIKTLSLLFGASVAIILFYSISMFISPYSVFSTVCIAAFGNAAAFIMSYLLSC